MKKLFAFLAVIGILSFGVSNVVKAQAEEGTVDTVAVQDSIVADTTPAVAAAPQVSEPETVPAHQAVKAKFIEGGPVFMSFVLLCLIFGLALAIERIIYLNLATTNTDKLLVKLEGALEEGGIEAAKEVCRNTRGPVASIFYQGLDRIDEGLEMVEKSIISYGSVQMGLLEKNLSWISLFIAIAPMLGFMGTVLGMIQAFDKIAEAGDVSASLVADGIGMALITTVSGLIVAVFLQVFYNYLLSKIDTLVNRMEDASISFMDILVKYNLKK
ncbi:MAG: MotA/TolQ/ExbB proton channel family protein [Bacteroidales bacterium]|nr:MotA/TolQ/ExbB proton channel family protein [Bacteroidales bacterium]MBN2821466.1 MotA/TolQ/ExbB proton channel family protein [Bacteroidales bacterium]